MEGWRELWAIPVEFQYYFAIPLIAIISVRMHRRWIYLLISATLVASIIYGVSDPETVFSNGLNIFPKAGPFLMGTTLALLVHHQYLHIHKSSRFMSGMVILVSLSGLTFATVLYQCRGSACIPLDQLPWLSILIGLSVTGLMFSALRANWVSKTLSLKPLVYLGEISFSLYLLHLPVILLVLNYIDLHPAITAWIAFLLSITLASATYWLIERPGMKMGRVLSQRIPLTQ